MDRIEKASNTIKYINEFRSGAITEARLTTEICDYFDFIKDSELTPSDMKFLKYISNILSILISLFVIVKYSNNLVVSLNDLISDV